MSSDFLQQIKHEFFSLIYALPAPALAALREYAPGWLMQAHLRESLVAIGKHLVADAIGPVLPISEARRVLRERNRTAPTARAHVDHLIAAGELVEVGDGNVRIRQLWGRITKQGSLGPLPTGKAFWRDYAKLKADHAEGAKRGRSTRRATRKSFAQPVAKNPLIPQPSGSGSPPYKSLLTPAVAEAPAGFCISERLRSQNTELTAMADLLAEAPLPVLPEPATEAAPPAETPSFVVADAPIQDAPVPQPEGDPDIAAFQAFCRRMEAATTDEAAQQEQPPQAPGEPVAIAKPVPQPKTQAPAAKPATPTVVHPTEVALLAEEVGVDGLNVLAVVNTGAPFSLVRQAFGILVDAERDDEGRRRGRETKFKPVRNPPAFLLGTVRRLMLHQRRA